MWTRLLKFFVFFSLSDCAVHNLNCSVSHTFWLSSATSHFFFLCLLNIIYFTSSMQSHIIASDFRVRLLQHSILASLIRPHSPHLLVLLILSHRQQLSGEVLRRTRDVRFVVERLLLREVLFVPRNCKCKCKEVLVPPAVGVARASIILICD